VKVKAVSDYQITTIALPQGQVDKEYKSGFTVVGGVEPNNWSATNLPPGLELDAATGEVTGKPTQYGDYSMTVTATDSAVPAHQDTETVTVKIISGLKIQTTSLSKATVNAKYPKSLSATGGLPFAIINGNPVYKWTITSGSLPDGLAMDSSGKISGTPTTTGNSTFTVQVKDNETTPATDTVSLTLKVVPSVQIAAVEFTQAIQQYETLDDLNTSLGTNGEPPVPIISGKPGVMRVYFTRLDAATDVVLNVDGAISGQKAMNLPPDCDPSDARIHLNFCPSMDFYFTPSSGAWTTTLTLKDDTDTELETETFTITSRDTRAINLKGVSICSVANQPSSCQSPAVLLGLTGVMSAILPTSSVPPPTILPDMVESPVAGFESELDNWSLNTSSIVDTLYVPADAAADQNSNQRTDYVGVYSSSVNSTGVGEIGKHGLVIPNTTTRLGVVNTPWTLAHEVGHTLNLLHTNLSNPQASTPPGCWNRAQEDDAYWPYFDNRVQSSAGDEYGFDVANGSVVAPNRGFNGSNNNAFELMAYCVSRWISPLNYKRAMLFVNGGAVPAPSVRLGKAMAQDPGLTTLKPRDSVPFSTGSFWNISGIIKSTGLVLDPIFTETMLGTSDPGSGTYSIEELDSGGQVLFTRNFEPGHGSTETLGTDVVSDPHFSEFVPATPGTASIVVLDPNAATLATATLTGTAPTVAFTSPTAGFVGSGQQTVSWTASSATATQFTSHIFYSADSGASWQRIIDSTALSTILDFDVLPGSSSAMLRVDVTDGVNTGSATSVLFSVPKKVPSAIVINTPLDGAVRVAADPIYLSGAAFDVDDGTLTGTSLRWSSDVQGDLGTGTPLSVNLQPGKHTITLTATDSDGNVLTATTHITLGGAPPFVTLSTNVTGGCTTANISAVPGSEGADLAEVDYSLDGGNSYTAIPLASLPVTLPVTGSGTVEVVALAADASGQVSSKSSNVTAGAGCSATTLKANTGSGQSSPVGAAFSTALTTLVADGTGSPVAGVTVNYTAPTSGASATLSATSATTNASGLATVTATANGIAGSYNITAAVANTTSTATFALTNSDFNIAAASSTVSVGRGSSTTDVITLTALGGFNGTVNFTCSGLPSGTTCTFSPAQLTPTAATASTTMTITNSQTASMRWPAGGVGLLACAMAVFLPRRRKHLSGLMVLCVVGALTCAGCGGSSPIQKGTTATVTVAGSSGTLQRTTTITLQIK
jgi:hypothetical protein